MPETFASISEQVPQAPESCLVELVWGPSEPRMFESRNQICCADTTWYGSVDTIMLGFWHECHQGRRARIGLQRLHCRILKSEVSYQTSCLVHHQTKMDETSLWSAGLTESRHTTNAAASVVWMEVLFSLLMLKRVSRNYLTWYYLSCEVAHLYQLTLAHWPRLSVVKILSHDVFLEASSITLACTVSRAPKIMCWDCVFPFNIKL